MLVPREHGAYGQLLFPVATALVVGRPAAAAYLLAAAGTTAFLAHESLLVLLGQRGARAAREQRTDARRSLAVFGGIAVAAGLTAVAIFPRDSLPVLGVPAVLAALVGVVVAAGRERSTVGEVLVAIALSSLSWPVALAGGSGSVTARTIFLVFAVVFCAATVAVRALIGRTSRGRGPAPAAAGALTMLAVVALWAGGQQGIVAEVAPWAALPVVLVGLAVTLRPPAPRHLRAIGWTLVSATLISAVVLTAALI